ncbi:hypothetical protein DUI87_06678 [Hirundo rustica rustica]|uniref:Uncharacterized protein n=1 Tax=Hirundo rustica rustica TaxID=333673 RepID=A0A3M0KUI8_HIRRU|nr:hypothetical protein DUI87_06678 [Hirundo rustica rustica]
MRRVKPGWIEEKQNCPGTKPTNQPANNNNNNNNKEKILRKEIAEVANTSDKSEDLLSPEGKHRNETGRIVQEKNSAGKSTRKADTSSSPGSTLIIYGFVQESSQKTLESENHRMVWVGRDIKAPLIPSPAMVRDTFH